MSLIYTRKATKTDLSAIVEIINEAKTFLKNSGSSQWQGEYPNVNTIETDLSNNVGYCLIVDGEVAGYAAVITGIEPTYQKIENGNWQYNHEPYTTIHRIAISNNFRGMHLASFFFSNLISLKYNEGISNFRIDTSKNNQIMQHLALSHNFIERGIIYVDEDPVDKSRLAYELNLQ